MTNKKKDVESIHYLSPLQQGLLFHAVSDRSADPYFVQTAFLLEGPLDVDTFERAWQALAERHPILRTGFVWEGVTRPVQVVRPRAAIPVARHDLRGLAEGEREEALAALMAADRRAGFDLLKAPLMRLTLVQVEEEAFYFINSHHHLLLDGWSFALLLREALTVYQALVRGTVPELPRARAYREYLAWVQAQDEGAAERFFREALAGFRAPTPLPLPLPLEAGPAAAAGEEAFPFAEQALRFSRAETEALAACARRLRVTLNTLVQGAWALLLSRHSGEPDVVFGATVSGRPPELPGSEAIVGVLINTLPVRVRVDEHEPLAAWLSRLQDRNSELRQHEWTPLSLVQRWSEVPGGRSLFESLVVFDSYPEEEVSDAQSDVRDVRVRALPRPGGGHVDGALLTVGRNNYPLSLIVEPSSELGLILCYERRRLAHDAAASLLGQCRALLEAMAARPRARLAELPLVSAEERRRLLVDWNATAEAFPPACVHELFEAQAAARPGALAVVCEGTALTYGELDRRTNQLARRLRALGVGPDDRVALCIERSAELIVALLGVLKAGAAYVPVDPKFPRERLRAVVEDSGARVLITEERWAGAFDEPGPALLFLDRDAGALATESDAPLGARGALDARAARPGNLAYLIYTSGSTGRPKGVAVEHRHLVNYVRGVLARLPLAEGGGMALVSTVAADLGHTSLFGALCSGRTLHVLSEARIFDPDATAEYMSRHGVDALKIVPSHLAALLEAAHPERVLPARCLVLGGEASSWELIERIRTLAPGCAVLNHYGPTETTVGSLTWTIDPARGRAGATVPIGRPLPNTQAYVLGSNLEPVPVGVPGELYLGGAGVTRGYHARPELTAERFVPDPFGGAPGGRLYRTGDRVRLLADGAIEFLGRTDHQIKLRGHRVELGEIEARLREQPEVREAVVAAREGGGAVRLVAYVVGREAAALDAAALRARLALQLPDYMVPAAIVALPALPLTANGKIDRAALPEPERAGAGAADPRGFVAPRNEVEATLAQIWADILRVERVGIHDNFFALGGDSIRSLQVIARANQRGVKLSPKDLFDHPTVAAAAAVAASGSAAAAGPDQPAAPPGAPPGEAPSRFPLSGLTQDEIARNLPDASRLDDVYPLSPMQEGMLFHTLLNPGSGIYLMQQHYVWHGALDADLVVEAWRRVAARHPILRTSFVWKDLERPLQLVHREVDLSEVIQFLDWRDQGEAAQEKRLAETLEAELAEGLDMTRAPLMRIRLIRVREDAYRIVRSFHHILTDDWCFSVLMMECLSYYAALREGRSLELPEPRPYRDYIAWLARQDLPAAERFWREELRGFAEPTPLGVERVLPEGAAPPAGAGVSDAFAELPGDLTEALLGLAHQHGLTPNTLVQGAWALLLSRYSGQRDIVFGVTVAGRPTDLPGVETIVGLFINSLPLRVRVSPEQPLLAWLKGLLAHNYRIREFEYPPLVEIQRWSELPKGQSLFNSLLVFENAPKDPRLGEQVGDVRLSYEQDRVHTNYPMTVVAYPGAGLGIRLSYDRRLFDHEAVERMLGHLVQLLSEMARRPEALLGDLSLLSEPERRQLLLEWNDTKGAEPAAPGYVALFEAQVRRTPDAEAVTCRGRRLTYAALNRAANQVARALRAEGVGPDTIVAVLEARDIELLVALLGVLKAGGAYLPLDPHQPEQRLAGVVASSRAPVVVTSEAWVPRLGKALAHLPEPARPRFVTRERLAAQRGPATAPIDDLPPIAGPGHLAYVITTSGSTGVPKGAMVEHAGMLNNVWGKIPALELGPSDVIGQTASQCFDISVWQLLTALLCGGRVHIVPEEIVGDPRRLLEEVEAQGITVLELVPSLLRELVAEGAEGREAQASASLGRLRWMLPTGEALTPELCRRWFERYPRVPLMNAYGPAECADDVALHAITAAPAPELARVPIGRPVPNVRLHVVTGGDLAPVGVTGEICVAGVGVGRGYLNDPARTAEAFVPDPFGGAPGARMYRTGDLGRRLADGAIEFSGRRDHQVKIRGFRIELGEIEARLAQHPEVREAVVAVREEGPAGKRLVAYVVGAAGEPPPPERLRGFLKETLPDYMVPPVFVALPALPLTPNGKVDRKALPAPEAPAAGSSDAAGGAPRTPTEQALAGIWAEVLGLDRVPVHAGFFDLGGHSLLATQVVSRVRKALGVELPLRSLFDHPTVAELARDVDQRLGHPAGASANVALATGAPPIVPAPRQGPLPLSFAQQRLWFLSQLEPDSAGYNMTAAVRVEGALDVALLRESLAALVRRHESLRTTFGVASGEPVQVIDPEGAPAFEVVDLSAAPAAEQGASVQRLAEGRAERPFDLGRGPLLRVTAIQLREDELVLVVVVHHIVADGWTMNVLVAELAELYAAARAARPPALRPLPVQYADFAVWQRRWMQGPVREALLGAWRERLSGHPKALDLRPDHPRPAAASHRGARHTIAVDRALSEALRALGRREGATLFMTLLAAFKVVLLGRTGQSDLLVGTDVAGRNRAEIEGLIGFFVNLLVLRTDLGGMPTFRELLQRVREVTLDAYAHQDLPFEQVVDALRPPREPGRHPLVQTLFVLQNVPASEISLPGVRFSAVELDREVSRFDLGVFVEETDEGLTCAWKYRADLFEPPTIAAMAAHFMAVLRAIVDDPDRRVTALAALAAAERKERTVEGRARDEGRLRSLKRITPRKVDVGPSALVATSTLGDGPLPLVVKPAVDDVDLAAWAREERAFVEAQVLRHGAVLFRGFPIRSAPEFEQVAQAICGELFGEYGDLPREKTGKHIYSSTPYPADKAILFHNESSHLPRWPLKQWFFCVQAAPEGGATPIVDCRRLYEALAPDVRERFRRSGLLYVRNFTPGFDVGWQDFFHTTEPAVVEERCRAGGMRCEWLPGGRLRISQRGPAVLSHPKTGEQVFFNQIQLHHPAYLEAPVRESLLAMVGEEWLPRNVCYGDGAPIEAETTRALGEAYERCAVRFPWQEGDIILLDNMLVAHGRDPFSGPRKIVVAMGEMMTAAQASQGAVAS
ncbi:amino acid adenylation domain-containing protein [Sorangium sp. So ce388]|uniref:amino acid adenylation domain-containing protein n=1 Tax=Sorangium sp. So ce388 TaxID=3133309 RepID=UPI003F5B51DC